MATACLSPTIFKNTTYEFGDSVTEENKTLVKGLFERMAKNQPEKSAFKIIEVDEKC